ncbi:hypothetical protein [Singulisphaera sp. GP187]|uniref:hypothetical protein n=1 Tax=Singulisphaera sp. GP187 TaxID=1882752 RepID=UPI0011613D3D|nr:hypothetical protein [Singulisphaera sp. GP187]
MRDLLAVFSGTRLEEFDFQAPTHFWDLHDPVAVDDLQAEDNDEDRRLLTGVRFEDEHEDPIRYFALIRLKCKKYILIGSMHFDQKRPDRENKHVRRVEIPKATARQLLLKCQRPLDRSGKYDLPEDLQQPIAAKPVEDAIEIAEAVRPTSRPACRPIDQPCRQEIEREDALIQEFPCSQSQLATFLGRGNRGGIIDTFVRDGLIYPYRKEGKKFWVALRDPINHQRALVKFSPKPRNPTRKKPKV